MSPTLISFTVQQKWVIKLFIYTIQYPLLTFSACRFRVQSYLSGKSNKFGMSKSLFSVKIISLGKQMEESKTQKNIQTSKFSQLLEIILYSLTTSSVFTVAKQSTLNTNHHLMADPFTKQAGSELSLIICLGTNLSSVAKLAFFWLSVWICHWSLNQTGESNYLERI